MKNITKSLIILFGILSFSCTNDDVEDRPVIVAGDAPVLSAPADGASYVLAIENAAAQIERFVWSSASFGQDVAITYTVEIDKAGAEFANAHSLGSVTGQNQVAVTVETLNGAVNSLGATPFEAGQYEVRIKAAVNDTFEPLYSNVIAISVTSYVAIVPPLYFVGQPQSYYGKPAWTPENGIPMRYVGNGSTKVYEAYVKVQPGDGFKFTGGLNWDNGNFGVINGAQDGNLKNGGDSGDVKVAETDGPGLYYVWVDIDNLKYKAVKMNWGIIGDATPGAWNDETPMTYDFTNNKFTIAATLGAGGLKFRSANTGIAIYPGVDNNQWKFNVGNSDPKVVYNPDAPNFTVTAGSYNLELSIDLVGNATVTGL